MTQRRALVVHVRMPAFDRDSGSQDVDNMVRFLLRAGWKVTFLAREGEDLVEERHARRLRSMGVATHAGFADVDRLLRSNEFDLAIVAFWELAAELLPQLRRHSPATRVVVNSVDVHFLRLARQSFGQRSDLDPAFGRQTTRELNVYNAADAVLAVSDKERDLLADFLGETRVFTLPIAESVERSRFPLAERRGMYFVGNFRHLPNREAVEHLANDVLPQLDPALLERHPLTVLGNWLDRVRLDVDPDTPGLRLVGWVPSIQPYTDRARLAAVPLLHGAGVKRKVIQAMMAGTPVVTTPVGAEGLDLVQGETALIASDASDLAAGISRLLTDDALWHGIADAGAEHAQRRHGLELVEQRFGEILEHVMATRPGVEATADATEEVAEIRQRIQGVGRPGDVVLVACGDTTELLDVGAHPCWPFPQAPDGGVGREMVDGPAAVNHLEALRTRGARYLVLPRAQFGWRRRYPELFEHLEREHQRLHHDELVAVFDLSPDPHDAPRLDPVPRARVLVLGSYAPHRTGPSPMLVQELSSSGALTVEQRWRPDGTDDPADDTADDPDDDVGADFVVHVRDDAILPAHFVDRLVATMVTLDVDRLQPTHTEGPAGGPPITERHFGVVARELDQVTPIPVLAVRAGADPTGPTVLADTVTIGLRRPVTEADAGPGCVRRIWILDDERRAVVHARPEPSVTPRISVLIATYERPDLLREALASFAAQTLPTDEFEVVVVDDGSQHGDLDAVLADFTDRISVTGVRIGHAGRSAAKNVAVMLARAPLVLFFDDDDRAADDYLERHLAAHAAKPADGVAVLGHTEWAPELERSALMHYITDVDRLMFAYERLGHGQELDWRGFWEGRISCKRAFLLRYGLHDQRFGYSIDIEMGWRLAPAGLRIVYDATARSFMARPIDFDAFCARTEAKGRAHALIATVHAGSEIAERLRVDDAEKVWDEHGASEPGLRRSVALLEARAATDPAALPELHEAYRRTFRLLHAKGAATTAEETRDVTQTPTPTTVHPFPNTDPELAYDATPPDRRGEPLLSVTLPVWSRTPELAAMARRTVDRIWEVARIPTEVVVVDNGSPHTDELAARVHRYPENKGVATGWNTGVRLSRAPMVVVLNSDCTVQPGWDVALYEAASHGRRVAFPYTDHCDGQGFTSPDQGGTAGWCFMLSRALYDEVGVFDEWFNPAFCEDTDYWHRAWQMGVELTPVPAARVVHARRTTASTDARVDMLLQGHRYKYGWKHGVDPDRAPPYYNREIVEYVGSYRAPRPGATPDPGRPRVFGIGLNKTGTTSLHQALRVLGYDSLHWGGPALRRFIETSLAEGAPLLSRLDPHLDAFSDIQVLSEHYELLDTQYPGSRFVLTVRPLDDWIASRRRHVETNRRRKEAGTYHGRFLEVDEPAWREHWTRHVEGAREYFAGRDDFLELDLIASPDWRPLCDLLGRPRPTIDFPWANRGDDE
jgi:GT2 family glycosyltransferase/glycosyltransferase involved in cell wall biosynthesis